MDKSLFIPSLARGEFNQATLAGDVAGGKGTNAARMLKRLGEPVKSLILLGGLSGQRVAELIRSSDGIEPIVAWTASATRTIVTVREEELRTNTAFVEPNGPVTQEEIEALRKAYLDALEGTSIVIFGGSVPDSALDGIYAEMIQAAKSHGVRAILDSRGQALRAGIEAAPFMAKPNLRETEDLLGAPLRGEKSRWQAIEWYESKGIEVVVLSMGAQGALASLAGTRWRAIPPRVEQINPVGSGDCLVAGMAAGIRRGWHLEEALRLGIACGAANAAVWEAAHVAPEQVQDLMPRVVLEPADAL